MTPKKRTKRSNTPTCNPRTRKNPKIVPAAAQVSRRSPKQERSRFTVQAILEAAAELIGRSGYDRSSTNRIAERAGVSIGSLYQYFPNKEAVLARLISDHRSEVHRIVEQALPSLQDSAVPLSVGLRSLFDNLINYHRIDPALNRALAIEVPRLADPSRDAEELANHARSLAKLLASRGDVEVADIDAAALVVARTVESLTRWLAHEFPENSDTAPTVEAAVAMLAGFLTGQTPE